MYVVLRMGVGHKLKGGFDATLSDPLYFISELMFDRHFFGSINLGATTTTLRATVLLAEKIAEQLDMACPWKTDHHMVASERVDFDDMDTDIETTDNDYRRDKNESAANDGEKRDHRKDKEEYEPEPEHIFVSDFQFLDRIMAR